jgi:hypothetical protein
VTAGGIDLGAVREKCASLYAALLVQNAPLAIFGAVAIAAYFAAKLSLGSAVSSSS